MGDLGSAAADGEVQADDEHDGQSGADDGGADVLPVSADAHEHFFVGGDCGAVSCDEVDAAGHVGVGDAFDGDGEAGVFARADGLGG